MHRIHLFEVFVSQVDRAQFSQYVQMFQEELRTCVFLGEELSPRSVRQASCLLSPVLSLSATQMQVEFADRQLREQGKFQVALDPVKSRETFRQNSADISTDSLDLSTSDEGQLLHSSR